MPSAGFSSRILDLLSSQAVAVVCGPAEAGADLGVCSRGLPTAARASSVGSGFSSPLEWSSMWWNWFSQIALAGKGSSRGILANSPAVGHLQLELPRSTPRLILNVSTTSLGNLLQCLTTLTVQSFLLVSSLTLPCSSFKPLPLTLVEVVWGCSAESTTSTWCC